MYLSFMQFHIQWFYMDYFGTLLLQMFFFSISHKHVLDALHEAEPLNDPRYTANDRQNNIELSNTPTTLVKKVTFVNKGS